MFAAQPVIEGPCDTCRDTGNHPTKRKKPCPDCGTRGARDYCTRCFKLTSEHKQIVGGWLCDVPSQNLSMIMRIEEDGSRTLVRMESLKKGDRFHMCGNQHVDWRKPFTASVDAYRTGKDGHPAKLIDLHPDAPKQWGINVETTT